MKALQFLFILLLISTLALSQTISQKVFEGSINSKIPIILTLNFSGETVYGNVVYKKKGIPISVIGGISDNNLFLYELMPNGIITGIYSAVLKQNKIMGTWSVPKQDSKGTALSLIKTKEQNVSKKSLKDVTGSYKYSFGEENAMGNLYVQQIGGNKIAISFDNIMDPPGYNGASISKTVLKLANNQAIYESNEFGKCKFIITFLEGGATVYYEGNSFDCGFGHNAYVSGSYIKVSSQKPKFETLEN
ncbi:MAG: hypothetical protein U5N85_05360 [Arcicella sp.]|nr:hypothetical protein [Arcicella sp.]